MTLEEFSGGYYRTEMTVQPYSDGPVIERGLYDRIDNGVYAQTDAPVTVRVGMGSSPYFQLDYESAVPVDVLAMPREWMDDMGIHNEYETQSVYVLKPEHSYVLNQSVKLRERFDNHNINEE